MIKILDRILLLLYSLVVGILSIIVLGIATGWIPYSDVATLLNTVYKTAWVNYWYLAVSILLLLISVRFFYISLRRSQANAPSIDQRTDYGDIRISLETVENLSLKAASRIRGLSDVKARVRVSDAGLEISIRSIVDGENPIPSITEEVQRSVKDHLEEITGIPVAHVSVYIANILHTQAFRSRVE